MCEAHSIVVSAGRRLTRRSRDAPGYRSRARRGLRARCPSCQHAQCQRLLCWPTGSCDRGRVAVGLVHRSRREDCRLAGCRLSGGRRHRSTPAPGDRTPARCCGRFARIRRLTRPRGPPPGLVPAARRGLYRPAVELTSVSRPAPHRARSSRSSGARFPGHQRPSGRDRRQSTASCGLRRRDRWPVRSVPAVIVRTGRARLPAGVPREPVCTARVPGGSRSGGRVSRLALDLEKRPSVRVSWAQAAPAAPPEMSRGSGGCYAARRSPGT